MVAVARRRAASRRQHCRTIRSIERQVSPTGRRNIAPHMWRECVAGEHFVFGGWRITRQRRPYGRRAAAVQLKLHAVAFGNSPPPAYCRRQSTAAISPVGPIPGRLWRPGINAQQMRTGASATRRINSGRHLSAQRRRRLCRQVGQESPSVHHQVLS
jgi:hypothetical protein